MTTYSKRALHLAIMDDAAGEQLTVITSQHIKLAKSIILGKLSETEKQVAKERIEQLRIERDSIIEKFQEILDTEEMLLETFPFDPQDALETICNESLSPDSVIALLDTSISPQAIYTWRVSHPNEGFSHLHEWAIANYSS